MICLKHYKTKILFDDNGLVLEECEKYGVVGYHLTSSGRGAFRTILNRDNPDCHKPHKNFAFAVKDFIADHQSALLKEKLLWVTLGTNKAYAFRGLA